MQLGIHTIESAPTDSRPILQGIVTDLGVVPNLAGAIAASPALLAGFDGLRRAVASTKLDPVHREVAGLATGVAIDNEYGVAFHSTVLDRLGTATDDLEVMRSGREPADAAAGAVYALARTVAIERGSVPANVIERARTAGLDDEAILEVVLECTFAGLVGTLDALLDRIELDGFLAARAWQRSAVG
jgi:alkylhydroperoxidase family enzyme